MADCSSYNNSYRLASSITMQGGYQVRGYYSTFSNSSSCLTGQSQCHVVDITNVNGLTSFHISKADLTPHANAYWHCLYRRVLACDRS